ncbi:MAG TPA: hypothetical protein V6C58_08445 [Allocoleopsis sp.]
MMNNSSSYGQSTRLCCLVNKRDEINAELDVFQQLFPSDHPIRLARQNVFNPDKI